MQTQRPLGRWMRGSLGQFFLSAAECTVRQEAGHMQKMRMKEEDFRVRKERKWCKKSHR